MSRPTYGYGADESSDADGALPAFGTPGQQEPAAAEPGVPEVPSAQEPPVCPRHPDRVSYVRCQRCGSPVCPQCQRPAAVGVLCPDCADAAQRASRATAPRGALGARTTGQPVVTITVIALCVLVYLGQMIAPQIVEQLLIFAPVRALAMPWTFLTAGFLHGSITHLLLNMVALWMVGRYLEQSMGHWRYLGVYLVSILAGNTAVLLLAAPMSVSWVTPVLGASGGIFGLFGSLFVVNRRLGLDSSPVIVLIGLNLIITFLYPNISWQGHLGGLVLGTATTAVLFALRPRLAPGADRAAVQRRSAVIHAGVIAGAALICAALIVLKVLISPPGSLPIL